MPWLLAGSWQQTATARPKPVIFSSTINERTKRWDWKRRFLALPKAADSASILALKQTRGGTVVAVGNSRRGEDVDAAIWTSPDRATWHLFHPSDKRATGLQNLTAVTNTQHGFIAVGSDGDRPLVLRGTRSGLRRLTVPGAKDFRGFRSISSNGEKEVIIVGVVGKVGTSQPIAYISADEGATWKQSEPFPTHSSTEIIGIANLGRVYVGVGSEITPNGPALMLWRSDDAIVDNQRVLRWRRAAPAVIDEDTGDSKSPTNLTPVSMSGAYLALYDQHARKTLFAFLDNSLNVHTLKVDIAPNAFDVAAGPLALKAPYLVATSYGAGRPNVSVFDFNANSWVTNPDPERSTTKAFPARTPGRSATIVVQGAKGTEIVGVEGPLRGKAPGSETYRMISWRDDGGALAKPTTLKLPVGTYLQAAVRAENATYLFGFQPDKQGTSDGAIWRYGDDGIVTDVKPKGLGGPGDQRVFGAMYSNAQWVAVGTTSDDQGGTDAAVWQSDDGETWQTTTSDEMIGAGDQRAFAVCPGTSGEPIIVGSIANREGVDVPAAWFPKGQAWIANLPAGNKAGQLTSCAKTDEGLDAVGPYSADSFVWHTKDGKAWTSTPLPISKPKSVQLAAVASSRSGTVVTGAVNDGTDHYDLGVWVISKGGKPLRVAESETFRGAGSQIPASMLLRGKHLMIVGSSGPVARVWQTNDVFKR